MKTLLQSLALGLCCVVSPVSAEPASPTVQLVVKKHLMDSDHDKGGKFGSNSAKTYTFRVEVTNLGNTTLTGAEISGTALVHRSRAMGERVSRESLSAVPVPDLKSRDKVTLDLGRIDIHELELRQREMQESIEEWKVICTKAGSELGNAVSSSKFEALDKEASGPTKEGKRGKGGKGGRKNK